MPPSPYMDLGGPQALQGSLSPLRQILPPFSPLSTHPLIFFFAEKKL